jgi:hypothetical protein
MRSSTTIARAADSEEIKMSYRLLALTVAGIGFMGCQTGSYVDAFRKDELKQAAFAIHCPAEQVQVTGLKEPDNLFMYGYRGSKVGVSGCGKDVVYLNLNGTWIANTANTQ